MGDYSSIEWTESTWNPTTGCNKVSPGCKNCYAERLATRLEIMGNPKYKNGFQFTLQPGALELPLSWKRPRKIFVNSMSDLFHESMPWSYLDQCFDVMFRANWHTYQILTKRPDRMKEYINKAIGKAPENIWLGTSVEMDLYVPRIDTLREVCAATRFISFEPLLSSCLGTEGRLNLAGISWAITGGESDRSSPRAADPSWFREIRDECLRQKVMYFHKQNGGKTKCECHHSWGCRLLDGRTWNEMPGVSTVNQVQVAS